MVGEPRRERHCRVADLLRLHQILRQVSNCLILFSPIVGMIIPTDEVIFFRGVGFNHQPGKSAIHGALLGTIPWWIPLKFGGLILPYPHALDHRVINSQQKRETKPHQNQHNPVLQVL